MNRKLIFIRDDDVYKYDKNFVTFFTFLKKQKIPIIYGVVPKLIEKKLVNFLNKEKKRNPELFDIVQHGWSHKNYSKNIKNKYEFGPSRTFTQQKRDIIKGYSKMKRLFGKNFSPAFVPPYHGFNFDTLKIINELKFPIFSAGNKVKMVKKNFLNLPTQISINDYNKKGAPLSIKSTTMIKRFLLYIFMKKNKKMYGIVLHHHAISNNEDFTELKLFFLFLKKLVKNKKIITISLSRLLQKKSIKTL